MSLNAHFMLWSLFFNFWIYSKNFLMHYYCHVKLCIFHWNFLKFKFYLYTTKKSSHQHSTFEWRYIDIRSSMKYFPCFSRKYYIYLIIRDDIWLGQDKSSDGNAHKHNDAQLDISLLDKPSFSQNRIYKGSKLTTLICHRSAMLN